jgi:outer membrane biosynthesis protein TonB
MVAPYNNDGSTVADTTNRDREAVYKKNWIQYLSKNLYFPANVKIINGDKVLVIVNFAVDEEGNVVNAFVSSSFHPAFDEIPLRMVKNSPKWLPAIDHNRTIKAYRRQPITFAQE